ncbi:MAG TPA: class I SAM-dependent methyltransferase [Stellaceae bacterium]|nr:class I SAM-dependent methyltransferase [Stellaceae bacterium]
MSGFSLDWLRLRAPFDLAARSRSLAVDFAAALPRARPLHLVDLGAGTGGNARALAPVIGGDQIWRLFDDDPALVAGQGAEHLAWAAREGHRAQDDGSGEVRVKAAGGHWRFRGDRLDLRGGVEPALAGACDGVTMAAFADLVGAAWIDRLAAALARRRLPLLAALTVDGRRVWRPAAAEDAIVRAAFARHQRRDKGFGPALGPDAPRYLAAALAAAGFAITTAPSDWQVGSSDQAMLRALVGAEAAAAGEAAPESAGAITAWQTRRAAELAAGILAVTIGHCDLLAVPR